MRLSKSEDTLILAAIILLGFVSIAWFDGEYQAVAGYDFATSLNPQDELRRSLYVWDERLYGGSPNAIPVSAMPYFLLQFVLERAAGTLFMGEEAFFLILFTLPGLSMLYFLRTIFHDDVDRGAITAFGSVFYMFNTFVVIKWNRGELITLFAYGLLPFLLGLAERTLKDGFTLRRVPFIFLALFFYPVSLGHSADFLILTAVSLVFISWRALAIRGERARRLKRAVALTALSVLVSAWWILPVISSIFVWGGDGGGVAGDGGAGATLLFDKGQLDIVRYYSSWATLLNVMKMWFFAMYMTSVEFSTQFYRPGTLLFPAIAFSALLFRRNAYVLFFSALALLGIWLTKGTSPPFSGLYEWMHANIPFFFIFRAPSRYFPLIYAFALAPLIGFSAGRVISLLKKAPAGATWLPHLAATALIGLIFFHAWPLFSRDVVFRTSPGDILHPSVFVNVPAYYQEVNEWLKEKDGYFRLHSFQNQTYLNYTWNYSSTDVMPKLVEFPQTLMFRQELTLGSSGFQRLMDSFDRSLWSWDFRPLEGVLSLLSVKYIAVSRDVLRRYSPDSNYVEIITPVLADTPGIRRAADFGAISLYENTGTLPHAYAATMAKAVIGDESSLIRLSGTGYLERPALVITKDPARLFEKLPSGSVDEAVLVDKNLWDVFLDNFPLGERPPDMADAGFTASSSGEYAVFAKRKEWPGPLTLPTILVDGAPPGRTPEGLDLPAGVRWRLLGLWSVNAGGHQVTVEPRDPGVELLITGLEDIKRRALDLDRMLKTNSPTPISHATTVMRAAFDPDKLFARVPFYSGEGRFNLEAKRIAQWKRKRSYGLSEDYSKEDRGGWVLFDGGSAKRWEKGVVISHPVAGERFKAAKKLGAGPGHGATAFPAFDPEKYPYIEADWEDISGVRHELLVTIGLDTDGDGWADAEVPAAKYRPDGGRETMHLGQEIKRVFGYPGKRSYAPLWAGFEFKKTAGETPSNAKALTQEIRVKGLRAYHEEPVRAGHGGEGTGISARLDGLNIGKADSEGLLSHAVEVKGGYHELELQKGLKERIGGPAREEFLVLIKKTPEEPAGHLPKVILKKITPARYEAAVIFEGRGGMGDDTGDSGKAVPFWLVFNEAFNRGWKACPARRDGKDGEIWPGVLTDLAGIFSSKPREDEFRTHVMVNGYANAWWIEAGAAGGKVLHINIEYMPQRALRAGVFVSALSGAFFSLSVAASGRLKKTKGRERPPLVKKEIDEGAPKGGHDER